MSGLPAWPKEKAFLKELSKVLERATESRLKRTAEIAVEDERSFYKLVVKLLERAAKRTSAIKESLNLLFTVSEVLRLSRSKHGVHDKYGERSSALITLLLQTLAPTEHKEKARRILHLWRKEHVYDSSRVQEFARQLGVDLSEPMKPSQYAAQGYAVPAQSGDGGPGMGGPSAGYDHGYDPYGMSSQEQYQQVPPLPPAPPPPPSQWANYGQQQQPLPEQQHQQNHALPPPPPPPPATDVQQHNQQQQQQRPQTSLSMSLGSSIDESPAGQKHQQRAPGVVNGHGRDAQEVSSSKDQSQSNAQRGAAAIAAAIAAAAAINAASAAPAAAVHHVQAAAEESYDPLSSWNDDEPRFTAALLPPPPPLPPGSSLPPPPALPAWQPQQPPAQQWQHQRYGYGHAGLNSGHGRSAYNNDLPAAEQGGHQQGRWDGGRPWDAASPGNVGGGVVPGPRPPAAPPGSPPHRPPVPPEPRPQDDGDDVVMELSPGLSPQPPLPPPLLPPMPPVEDPMPQEGSTRTKKSRWE